MSAPPGPTGPASPPTGNPGLAADGLSKVREAVHLLEMALPTVPLGSEPHKAVLDAIKSLSKAVPPSEGVPGVQLSQINGLKQKAQQDQMMQAVMRSMGNSPAGGQSAPPAPTPAQAA